MDGEAVRVGKGGGRECPARPPSRSTLPMEGREGRVYAATGCLGLNCAASVDCARAVVDDAPPEMTWATWSK